MSKFKIVLLIVVVCVALFLIGIFVFERYISLPTGYKGYELYQDLYIFMLPREFEATPEYMDDLTRKESIEDIQDALKLYQQDTGRLPATLLELVPDYISLVVPSYISTSDYERILRDPRTNVLYSYQGTDGGYKLSYALSDGKPHTVSREHEIDLTADWETYRSEDYGFEMQYPENWDYVALELPNNPIMLAPQEIVGAVKQSLDNIEDDKTLSLTITFYDAMLFEGGILPYRNKSTEYIQRTLSEVEVDGVIGVYYTSEYIQDKGAYKRGEKTVTVDLPIENGYLSFHLFDDQYLSIFDQILSTFRFLE